MLFGLRITHRKPNLSVPGKGNAPSIGPEIPVNRESVEFGAILLYDYYIAGVLFIKNNKSGEVRRPAALLWMQKRQGRLSPE